MSMVAECPIQGCAWMLEQDDELEARNVAVSPQVAAALGTPLDAFLSIRNHQLMQRHEEALRQHFESHPILDWVKEVMDGKLVIQTLEARLAEGDMHAHDATWIDPLRLTLGQQVAAYANPLAEGDGPVAVGAFVHVDLQGSLDRDATVVLDADGLTQRLLIRTHHFALWKA